MSENLQPGQVLARGICRHLLQHNFTTMTEFVPARGLRVDVLAIGPKGEIWIVECKSCRSDFLSDKKWQGYLEWCDRFFWCVDDQFPLDILPKGNGLIIADGFDAQILQYGAERSLSAPRRKAVTRQAARVSMQRLQALNDPTPTRVYGVV